MTVLYVPMHLPIKATLAMIERETAYREAVSIRVGRHSLMIEHEPLSHESKAEMLSMIEAPIIV